MTTSTTSPLGTLALSVTDYTFLPRKTRSDQEQLAFTEKNHRRVRNFAYWLSTFGPGAIGALRATRLKGYFDPPLPATSDVENLVTIMWQGLSVSVDNAPTLMDMTRLTMGTSLGQDFSHHSFYTGAGGILFKPDYGVTAQHLALRSMMTPVLCPVLNKPLFAERPMLMRREHWVKGMPAYNAVKASFQRWCKRDNSEG